MGFRTYTIHNISKSMSCQPVHNVIVTSSSPWLELQDQYRWLLIDRIHGCSTLFSALFETFTSFFFTPRITNNKMMKRRGEGIVHVIKYKHWNVFVLCVHIVNVILTLIDMPWVKFMPYVGVVVLYYFPNGWRSVCCHDSNIHSLGDQMVQASLKLYCLHCYRTGCFCNL